MRLRRYGPFADQAGARAFLDADGRDPQWLAAQGAVVVTFLSTKEYWVDLPEGGEVDQRAGEWRDE